MTHIRIFALQMCAAYKEGRSRLRSWWDRIFFVNERHVGAKFALRRRFFIKIAIRFFAPPLQTGWAPVWFWGRTWRPHLFWHHSPRRSKVRFAPAFFCKNAIRWAPVWFWVRAWRPHLYLAPQPTQKPAENLENQGLSAGFIFCVPPFDC